jgi:RNA polymerase sigma-32 factor
VQKVAEELNVSTKEVLQMESRMASQDTAFDLGNDDDESTSFSPAQYLENQSTDVETSVINSDIDLAASNRLYSAIRTLDTRSQHIIETRWLSDDKLTLQDLADEYQVSAERVRQIEKNAMKKLQTAMYA